MPHALRSQLQEIRNNSVPLEKLEEVMIGKDKKKKIADQEEQVLLDKSKGSFAMTQSEKIIREEEYKKTLLNQTLASKLGDHLESGQIKKLSRGNNLVGAPPSEVKWDKLMVVEDPDERYPSFEHVLYCSLDYSLLILYIMFFILIEALVKQNSLLSMFIVYIIERIFRKIRKDFGRYQMCKKTYVDSCFLS
jgi:hypothetical protein